MVQSKATDIYYASRNSGWLPKVRLAVPTVRDQFQPSIDFREDQTLMIGYYTSSQSSTNSTYLPAWVKIDKNGNVLSKGLVADAVPTDPSNNNYFGFMGDYTDMWYWAYIDSWSSRWHFAHYAIKVPNSNGNIYVGAAN